MRPQVINVPVKTTGRLQVMCQPGTKTAGTVGTAHVHVESGLELQAAKLADPDGRRHTRYKHEGVGSRCGLHHVSDGITFDLWM